MLPVANLDYELEAQGQHDVPAAAPAYLCRLAVEFPRHDLHIRDSVNLQGLDVDGASLNCVDFGGSGSGSLLIHGLCGTGLEWANTAKWLVSRRRVVSYDQRGHGKSARRPSDVSHDALVNDAARVIEEFELAPATVFGQSLGARIAFLLASRHPQLVDELIVVDGAPDRAPDVVASVRESLSRWPVPFPSRDAAAKYFGGEPLTARVWADSLEERPDGFWAQFDLDIMLTVMNDVADRDYWDEWRRIRQRTLVVGGSKSNVVPAATLERMANVIPNGRHVRIEDAGHDAHLDRPKAWCEIVEHFLEPST